MPICQAWVRQTDAFSDVDLTQHTRYPGTVQEQHYSYRFDLIDI